jgi:hypothetical protein
MHQKKLILTTLLLFITGLTGVYAQSVIPTTGGNASGSGGSVSYSVGQVIYSTNTGTSGSEVQGVQQPFEISVITGLEEGKSINMQCSAYPNPATYYVNLKVENFKTENLSYQLYDVSGKLLGNKKIDANETKIDMHDLVISTYFLKITQNNKEIKVFKIIKN